MNVSRHFYIWAILLIAAISSCGEAPIPTPEPPIPPADSSSVWIVNEGNFQWANASLSRYSSSANVVEQAVFHQVNERDLGDVAQSASLFRGKVYLPVNNSGKVEVIDPQTGESIQTLTGFTSPRFFLGLNEQKAYVTDLYGQAVSIVDLEQGTRTGEIPLAGWTEELTEVNGLVWVTNLYREHIYLIDPNMDEVVDSVEVGLGSNSLEVDADGYLWVLGEGDVIQDVGGFLVQIDPESRQVVRSFSFEADEHPTELAIDPDGRQLYFLMEGIHSLEIEDVELPDSPWVNGAGLNLYGLGVHPQSGEVYALDAIDFVQPGVGIRYDTEGQMLETFDTGIIPGALLFVD
ncbi:DUF5074 domain-containing protein [Pontibacter sp. G13]|uniref:DUF5074 domain-containing protein n=1 Tax=Pontibacter sp. G13 TaxID=3074898 RepID=UPI00288C33DB|nr:DUF5074 domain-containing protein [Pontibacter sp. G13]WNJ19500.1 hypothetical protein RJD25_03315 [Pontibacter sp. G13]